MFSPTAAQPGAIWVLKNMGTPQVTFEKVDMVGYPAGVAFHPHGLGLLDKEDLLFVINHAYSNGGERVDVFKLESVLLACNNN